MSINGKRDHFTRHDLLQVATLITRFSEQQANAVIDEVINSVKRWPELAEEAGVFSSLRDEVSLNLRHSNLPR
jgi:serine/threonine-protein kinase HipA